MTSSGPFQLDPSCEPGINTMEMQLLAYGLHNKLVISIPGLLTATTVQEMSLPSSQRSLRRDLQEPSLMSLPRLCSVPYALGWLGWAQPSPRSPSPPAWGFYWPGPC